MITSENESIPQSRKILLWALTAALWLATAGVGFLAFVAIQNLAPLTVALVLQGNTEIGTVATRGWITTTRNFSTIFAGLLWLAVVVGGMEYHFRYVGQRWSYRVFAWTLGIEVALILLNLVVVELLPRLLA